MLSWFSSASSSWRFPGARPGSSTRPSCTCRAPLSQAYTSVTFYTRYGVAYYGINDRAAGRRVIELDLMTTAQRDALPEEEDVTAADRLIIESPTVTGLIVVRALSPEPGLMPMARASLERARCQTQSG